ncbi:TPA: DUF2073 domain-containing protein [Candidatus Woesearchaeota archaeon]|nr:DUF2073 domain-containing protein [Candidatus Woesearchaeota archaeon]HII68394.1 DUF2073 domain-containing protein [Candidatus Woesearchaeota archaeon]
MEKSMLSLQFVPYHEIEELGSARRVKKLLDIVKQDNIVLLQGRLKKEEEADLIAITMEEIDNKFKGIELAVVNPDKKTDGIIRNVKQNMVNLLLGDRQGFTIIGPASIVKDIKRDPDKIQLYTEEAKANGKGNSVKGRKKGT